MADESGEPPERGAKPVRRPRLLDRVRWAHTWNLREGRGELRHYCPELREYYPAVETCPSPWLKLVP